jgi:hypothetical protein
MKQYLLLIIYLTYFSGCEKNEKDTENTEITVTFQDGNYVGTFQRELTWTDSYTANVTMTFSSNAWTGTSNINKYPALCCGTYSIKGDTIVFENNCAWTAEFDWSLILTGKYFLEIKEDSVVIYRKYPKTEPVLYIDRYKLKKQKK